MIQLDLLCVTNYLVLEWLNHLNGGYFSHKFKWNLKIGQLDDQRYFDYSKAGLVLNSDGYCTL